MALNEGMFSSKRDDWETPWELYRRLDEEFGFTLDACATPENAKCKRFFAPADDGLAQAWTGVVWCNPPYGREIGKWVAKAYEASRGGENATVVCLLPARTDTAWWHDYCAKGEVRFLRGRVKFVGAKSSAPFPSSIVIFRGKGGGSQCP